jgi:SAM-dependent methyltransferase
MPFYENFSRKQPSKIGLRIADKESENVLRKILNYNENIYSVLELGPGRGPFAKACRVRGLDYTCADISWTLLNNLSLTEKRVQTLVPNLPFADNSFDLTFASNLLEHMIDYKDAFHFVDEMKRTTRPEGLVCHRVPNALAWGFHFWNGDYTHGFFTTPRTVSQVYLDVGLDILAVYPVSGYFVGAHARLVSIFARLLPSWLFSQGADRSNHTQMLYSLKTTFLLGFLIIGQKG